MNFSDVKGMEPGRLLEYRSKVSKYYLDADADAIVELDADADAIVELVDTDVEQYEYRARSGGQARANTVRVKIRSLSFGGSSLRPSWTQGSVFDLDGTPRCARDLDNRAGPHFPVGAEVRIALRHLTTSNLTEKAVEETARREAEARAWEQREEKRKAHNRSIAAAAVAAAGALDPNLVARSVVGDSILLTTNRTYWDGPTALTTAQSLACILNAVGDDVVVSVRVHLDDDGHLEPLHPQ